MDDVKEMQAVIAKLEKDISLNQMAKRSGINYVTLMNIKKNKSKRVTDGVKKRLMAFADTFTPEEGVPAKKVPAAKVPAKRGPKKGTKRAAKKAPVKKAAAKKTAKKAAAKKTAAKKPGPKPGAKRAARRTVAAPSKLDFASPVLGGALDREIEIAEARLEYLKSLRDIEDEFLKAVGRK